MASRQAITAAVQTLADAYGKQDRWVDGLVGLLVSSQGLKLPEWVTDQDCTRAAEGWCQDEGRPPVAQELRSAIMRAGRRPVSRGCLACGGQGTREVLQVWTDPETGQQNRCHAVSACTCEKGREFHAHAVYTDVIRAAHARPGFISVTVTDRNHPIITARERMGEVAWAAFRARAGQKGWGMGKDQAREDLRAALGKPEAPRQQALPVASWHDPSEWEG